MKRFKKLLLGLVTFAAVAVLCAVCAGAEVWGDYEYVVLDDGTVEITDYNYNGSTTELVIPANINGKSVSSIGYSAFSGCSSFESITIPDSVTSIGVSAFSGCSSLTSVTIPDSVTIIGDSAFVACTNLESITIPDSVTSIGCWAFLDTALLDNQSTTVKYADKWVIDCDSEAESVVIKDGTKGIAEFAFKACDNLTSITIPDSVTSICAAFFECTSLTSITIPDSVTSIGWGAFYGCTSLTSITIPDGVTSIGGNAFEYCSSLTSITIPDSVTSIGDWAFGHCPSLTSVTIPDSVTYIGGEAFYHCLSLTSIEIPYSVTYIGDYAFGYYDYDDDYNLDYWKNYDFKIYCYFGTAGKKYATENGFEYELLTRHTHTFGDWVTTKPATCGSNGEKTRTCTECGATETEVIVTTGHVYGEWITTKEATCMTTGTQMRKCTCGNFEIRTIEKTDHTYGEWTTTKAATCTDTGTQTRTCVCGTAETQDIPALGHNYVTTVVKPGYTAQGYTLHKCSRCDNSYIDNFTEKLTLPAVTGLKLGGRDSTALRLNWNKNSSASGYIIEQYKSGKWVRIAKITSKATTTYRVSGLSASTTYKFRMKAYITEENSTAFSSYTSTLTAKTNPSTVSGLKLGGRTASVLRLNWTKNTSADGYIIELYKSGKWVRIAKITNNATTTYRVSGLSAGTAYKFRMKAYKMNGSTVLYSGYTSTLSARTNPSNVTGVKIGAKAANALRVNWTKNTSAGGYIVEIYKGGKWVRAAKITKNTTVTYRIGGLARRTTYKIRIKAYKMSGKTTLYSGYTTISGKTT